MGWKKKERRDNKKRVTIIDGNGVSDVEKNTLVEKIISLMPIGRQRMRKSQNERVHLVQQWPVLPIPFQTAGNNVAKVRKPVCPGVRIGALVDLQAKCADFFRSALKGIGADDAGGGLGLDASSKPS